MKTDGTVQRRPSADLRPPGTDVRAIRTQADALRVCDNAVSLRGVHDESARSRTPCAAVPLVAVERRDNLVHHASSIDDIDGSVSSDGALIPAFERAALKAQRRLLRAGEFRQNRRGRQERRRIVAVVRDLEMDDLRDADDARKTVAFWADHGVHSFKVYTNITRAELSAVIEEAHARGLKVMGHLCSVTFTEAAALGIDELEHGPFHADTEFVDDKRPDICPSRDAQDAAQLQTPVASSKIDRLIAELVRRKLPISSTLPVMESFVENLPPDGELAKTLDLLDPEQKVAVLADRKNIADGKPFGLDLKGKPWPAGALLKKEMAFELKFFRAGGLLTAGPDPSGYGATIAGLGDWRELELLVRAGFTPVQAIHVATENGAIALGIQNRVGTLAVGKEADITLVTGDPSARISDIEHVETVFKGGVGYDSKKLFESVRGSVGRL